MAIDQIPANTWLVVKSDCAQTAEEYFQQTGITITTQGAKILGVALGVRPFVEKLRSEVRFDMLSDHRLSKLT